MNDGVLKQHGNASVNRTTTTTTTEKEERLCFSNRSQILTRKIDQGLLNRIGNDFWRVSSRSGLTIIHPQKKKNENEQLDSN